MTHTIKRALLLGLLLAALLLSGCGAPAPAAPMDQATATAARVDGPSATPAVLQSPATAVPAAAPAEGPMIDTTRMSSTMAYAELYNVLVNPGQYVGRGIRVEGTYYTAMTSDGGERVHMLLVYDSAACCELGVEFQLPQGMAYPQPGDTVQVEGTFRTMLYNGNPFGYIEATDTQVTATAAPPALVPVN